MKLVKGKTYAADVTLTGLKAAFGHASDVQAQFEKAGFAGVTVTDQGGGKFHATGTWNAPDKDAALPSEVSNVREVDQTQYGHFGDPTAVKMPPATSTPATAAKPADHGPLFLLIAAAVLLGGRW